MDHNELGVNKHENGIEYSRVITIICNMKWLCAANSDVDSKSSVLKKLYKEKKRNSTSQ